MDTAGGATCRENVANSRQEDVGRERLLQKRRSRLRDHVVKTGGLSVTGYQQDPGFRAQGQNSLDQFPSAHPRHDDVADENVDGTVMAAADFERLLAVGGLQHAIARAFEHRFQQMAQAVLVFDQQDGLRATLDRLSR